VQRWSLPLLVVPRVLVPGTQATLPSSDPDLKEGEQVALRPAAAGRGEEAGRRIATLAEVEGLRRLGSEVSLVRLLGRRLARLSEAGCRHGRHWVEATELAEPGPGAEGLLPGVERAMRRYLALRGEAGESGPGLTCLSRDPVTASHEVASVLQISGLEVQEILEAGTASDRLRRAGAVLDREAELLRQLLGREGT